MADVEQPAAAPKVPDLGPPAKAQNMVSKALSNAAAPIVSFFGSSWATSVFIGAIIVAIITAIIIYILYYYIANKVSNRNSHYLKETSVPVVGNSLTKAIGSGIPYAGNGVRMTMNFWIYISDINKYSGVYKHVFHRGDSKIANASPLVYLDKNSSKLIVRFEVNNRTDGSSISSMQKPFEAPAKINPTKTYTVANTSNDNDKITADLMNRGITIDYLPIQRWVFVSIVVNEESQNGAISAYVDGELVKYISSNQSETINGRYADTDPFKQNTIKYNFQSMVLDKGGDVWIGGDSSDSLIGPGFAGFLAGLSFYNYDLNDKDIYEIYKKGPIDNVLTKMGLPAYGVRSPIYRIN